MSQPARSVRLEPTAAQATAPCVGRSIFWQHGQGEWLVRAGHALPPASSARGGLGAGGRDRQPCKVRRLPGAVSAARGQRRCARMQLFVVSHLPQDAVPVIALAAGAGAPAANLLPGAGTGGRSGQSLAAMHGNTRAAHADGKEGGRYMMVVAVVASDKTAGRPGVQPQAPSRGLGREGLPPVPGRLWRAVSEVLRPAAPEQGQLGQLGQQGRQGRPGRQAGGSCRGRIQPWCAHSSWCAARSCRPASLVRGRA